MPRQINAEETRYNVSFIRERIGDTDYKKYPVDDLLFSTWHEVSKEVTREIPCLKETLDVKLVPNQIDYSSLNDIDLSTITVFESIKPLLTNGTLGNSLIYKTPAQFKPIEGDNLITNICYYTFDKYRFSIWRPPIKGQLIRLKIKCSRQPLPSEMPSYDKDPVIPHSLQDYINYGVIARLLDPTMTLLIAQYNSLFNGYKNVVSDITLDVAVKPYRDV